MGAKKDDSGDYAKRMVRLRKRLEWTQRELADEFMISHGSIGNWEKGINKIPGPVKKLIQIYESKQKRKG